jgi:hypothetical protein
MKARLVAAVEVTCTGLASRFHPRPPVEKQSVFVSYLLPRFFPAVIDVKIMSSPEQDEPRRLILGFQTKLTSRHLYLQSRVV